MEKEPHRIVQQFRAAAHGTPWHGDSILKILEGVTAEEAAARPIPNSHSIWDYLVHIMNWREYVVRNLMDATPYTVELNTEKDWTTITDFSEEAWQATLAAFQKSTDELSKATATVDPDKLTEVMPGSKYSLYAILHGVIQHDIYHSGQIRLLKKMLKLG
ncbi:MAG: DinB family protein [Bacteroidota bacterium]